MGEREEYYDRRAAEYDESITASLDAETTAAFAREQAALGRVLAALPPGRVLDVACDTALFTQHLRGHVVALWTTARACSPSPGPESRPRGSSKPPSRPCRLPRWRSTGWSPATATAIWCRWSGWRSKPRRAGSRELVVVDTAASDAAPDGWQERVLRNGSRYTVYKRHFTPAQLLAELGGDGEVLFAGRFLVAVRS